MSWTRRQNEIIDAALRLTAAGGLRRLTVKNLSAAIGVTEPAIYRHFRNKAEIVKALIQRFDSAVPAGGVTGISGVRQFIMGRFAQVAAAPDLARVMFAEELFMDDPEFTGLMLSMRRRHRAALGRALAEAQAAGEIRDGIAPDELFCILLGPVRLLVKQWGMSNGAFDLEQRGGALLETMLSLLRPEMARRKEGEENETENH